MNNDVKMNPKLVLECQDILEREARKEKEFLERQLKFIEYKTDELIDGISKIKCRIYNIKKDLKMIPELVDDND